MTCTFEAFGGGSRVVSLWDMLRFHADQFVEILNLIASIEKLLDAQEDFFDAKGSAALIASITAPLNRHLEDLQLKTSAIKANQLQLALTHLDFGPSVALGQLVNKYCEQLRETVAHELQGRAIYYISNHVDLLSDSSLFGDEVDEAFPSARYDISEAGRCLALRRTTACVLHLMRALETGLSSLSAELGVSMPRKSWEMILNKLQREIEARSKNPPDEKWKAEDEQFFSQAATHFRMIKDAWRNHAMHGRDKYTEEEAEGIYRSVHSFMRHLSERLSEDPSPTTIGAPSGP